MSGVPDSPQDKLSYSRGVLDKIRASYEKLTREELLDLLCYVSKTYIVEQTIPYDVPIPEREDEPREEESPPDELGLPERAEAPERGLTPAQQFARLVEGLKKRTPLPQLEHFSVEDGRAVLVVDNQKVTFGERVTVEFVAQRGRPRTEAAIPIPALPVKTETAAPAGARPDLPGGDGRTRQAGPKPPAPGVPARPAPKTAPPKEPDTNKDSSVERARKLDVD
jgi:hypothetical protein